MIDSFAHLSDEQLAEKIKENPDFLKGLIDRYWGRLFGYLRRSFYLENEDLEDLLQEIFLKAYVNLNDFDHSFKFSTWIYSIARNHAIDFLRKNKRKLKADILDDGEIIKILRANDDLEKELFERIEMKKIKEAINRLDFKYKEVLVLKFLEEKNYQEIMDIIKKPKGTVAALINRGRKQLLKSFGKKAVDE